MKKFLSHFLGGFLAFTLLILFTDPVLAETVKLYIDGTPIPYGMPVYYGSTQLQEIQYNGTVVYKYGQNAVFHYLDGSYEMTASKFFPVGDQIDASGVPTGIGLPGTANTLQFAGWGSSKSSVYSTMPTMGDTEIHLYAVYTHHHEGDREHQAGCYMGSSYTEGETCGNDSWHYNERGNKACNDCGREYSGDFVCPHPKLGGEDHTYYNLSCGYTEGQIISW